MRMNGFCALLTVACELAACGGQKAPPQTPTAPESPSPPASASDASAVPTATPAVAKPSLDDLMKETLEGIRAAFDAHDAKKVASFYTEDCTVADYGTPEAHGRDGVANGLQVLFDAFGDAKTASMRVWIKGNVAITEFVWAGTMTGNLMILKASNEPVGQLRVHVRWFDDEGLVKEEHDYGDQVGLIAQMTGKKGAPPVPAIPTNGPDVHFAKGTPDEDKLADWGKGVDGLFSKDVSKSVREAMAADSDVWINFTGQPALKGTKAISKGLDAWFKAFPDQKWSTSNAWGIDGFAIVEHTMTGTQKGALGPLPASGKPVKNWHWLDIWQPGADGSMEHSWGYANLLELEFQTGAFRLPIEKATVRKPGSNGGAPTGAAPKAGSPNTGGAL